MTEALTNLLTSSQLPVYLQTFLLFGLFFFGKGKGKELVKEGTKKLLVESLKEAIGPMMERAVKEGVRQAMMEALDPYAPRKKMNGHTQTDLDEVK